MQTQFEKSLSESSPRLWERIVARIARAYPLNSGRGSIANSKPMAALVGVRSVNVFARVFGGRAFVPLNDFVGRAMFYFGDLDIKISWVVRNYVRPSDTVLDIGTNLGLVSIQMAKIVGSNGAVHAFEPNPVMCVYLQKTLDANQDLKIKLHQIGLGSTEGELKLSVPQGNAGAASFLEPNSGKIESDYTVRVRCLSDVCREEGLKRIDFIKMDVEGFEAEVLSGGLDVLNDFRPRAILFEENSNNSIDEKPRSFQLLEELGYTVYAIPKSLLSHKMVPLTDPKSFTAHDFVALSK